nr:type III secretion system stator protein SctL [uncultured Pseudomonas sp.]
MFVIRRLSQCDRAGLDGPIVRREQLSEAWRAVDLIRQAREQAEGILADAQVQRQRCLDQATDAFWQQAGAFVQALQAEHNTLQEDVVHTCRELLNLALERVFDDCSQGERARVLLNHLAAGQTIGVNAILSCHPQVLSEVRAWLAASRFAGVWQVREDRNVSSDALCLSHDTGAFELDWAGLKGRMQAQER